jgi:hypothetical protein
VYVVATGNSEIIYIGEIYYTISPIKPERKGVIYNKKLKVF